MTCRRCGESLFWRPVDLRPAEGWWQCAQRHIWRLRDGRLVAADTGDAHDEARPGA